MDSSQDAVFGEEWNPDLITEEIFGNIMQPISNQLDPPLNILDDSLFENELFPDDFMSGNMFDNIIFNNDSEVTLQEIEPLLTLNNISDGQVIQSNAINSESSSLPSENQILTDGLVFADTVSRLETTSSPLESRSVVGSPTGNTSRIETPHTSCASASQQLKMYFNDLNDTERKKYIEPNTSTESIEKEIPKVITIKNSRKEDTTKQSRDGAHRKGKTMSSTENHKRGEPRGIKQPFVDSNKNFRNNANTQLQEKITNIPPRRMPSSAQSPISAKKKSSCFPKSINQVQMNKIIKDIVNTNEEKGRKKLSIHSNRILSSRSNEQSVHSGNTFNSQTSLPPAPRGGPEAFANNSGTPGSSVMVRIIPQAFVCRVRTVTPSKNRKVETVTESQKIFPIKIQQSDRVSTTSERIEIDPISKDNSNSGGSSKRNLSRKRVAPNETNDDGQEETLNVVSSKKCNSAKSVDLIRKNWDPKTNNDCKATNSKNVLVNESYAAGSTRPPSRDSFSSSQFIDVPNNNIVQHFTENVVTPSTSRGDFNIPNPSAPTMYCRNCHRIVDNTTMLEVHNLFHDSVDFRLPSVHNIDVQYHEKQEYECTRCHSKFSDTLHHSWIVNPARNILCQVCRPPVESTQLSDRDARSIDRMIKGLDRPVGEQNLEDCKVINFCEICKLQFIGEHNWRSHLCEHIPMVLLYCKLCKTIYYDKKTFIDHSLKHATGTAPLRSRASVLLPY